MLPKDLESIDVSLLQGLVDGQATEGTSLDFKESIDLSTDQGKDEFATGVSSMANAAGGDILLGFSERADGEKKGYATAFEGVEIGSADAFIQRAEAILLERLEPRLVGVRYRPIRLESGRHVIVVRVPRSWRLHAVRRNKAYVVYARNANGKYPLDFTQISQALVSGPLARDRAMAFRAERAIQIQAAAAPRRLMDAPKVVLHLLPVSAFVGRTDRVSLDLAALATTVRTIRSSGSNWTYNADGVLIYHSSEGLCEEYTQIYRDGRVEAFSAALAVLGPGGLYFIAYVPDLILGAIKRYVTMLRDNGVDEPLIYCLSILDAANVPISSQPKYADLGKTPIDRDMALLPEVELETSPAEIEDFARALRPLFDAFFQAGGHACCKAYNEDGSFGRDLKSMG